MNANDRKKLDKYEKPRLTVLAGGKAGQPRTHAELELERSVRALFYAMEGRKSKNLRNVAEGVTHPVRMLIRRFQEAKRARSPKNYELAKATVQEIDQYVDRLFNRDAFITGDPKKAA
jgi:transposase-like protein